MNCDFCNGKCNQVKASAFADDGTVCYLNTDSNEFVMYYDSAKHRFVHVEFKFCPMCGRPLDYHGSKKRNKKGAANV